MSVITDAASQFEKSSKPLYRRRECKALLQLILVMPILCYGALWIFAHYGGEWATSSDLPLPPNSQLLTTTYENQYEYRLKHIVYATHSTPETLREWFLEAGIPMTPIPLNAEGTSVIEYDDGYGTPLPFHKPSSLYQLHSLAATLTHGYLDEVMPDCQRIFVYKRVSFAANDFPTIDFRNAETVFSVTTCWPRLD